MRVSLSQFVEGVDPAAAARWWSDFRDGPHDHPFIPGHDRRIIARGAEDVTMEETTRWLGMRVFHETTTAWPGPREVRFKGKNDLAIFEGSYRFDASGGGTRIVLEAGIQLRAGLGWTSFAARPVVLAILKADLAAHAKEMRSELMGR